MKPGYRLAFELGIPVTFPSTWKECQNLLDKGERLWNEAWNSRADDWGLTDEGRKLYAAGCFAMEKGRDIYKNIVSKELGFRYITQIDWRTGEVKKGENF